MLGLGAPSLTDTSRHGDGGCTRNHSAPFQPRGAPLPARARSSALSGRTIPQITVHSTAAGQKTGESQKGQGLCSSLLIQSGSARKTGVERGLREGARGMTVSELPCPGGILCPWTKRPPSILSETGLTRGPAELRSLLQTCGFSCPKPMWLSAQSPAGRLLLKLVSIFS